MNKRITFIRTDVSSLPVGGNIAHGKGVVKGFRKNGWKVECYVPNNLKNLFNCNKENAYRYIKTWVGEILFNKHLIKKMKKQGIFYIRFSGFSDIPYKIKRKDNFIILEYNSSACWVMKNWAMTKNKAYMKFLSYLVCKNEKKAIEHADLIVVVSDVLKEELLKRGVEEERILVNPNGVDIEKFSPNINGKEIREKYNIEDNITLFGFIGTFGPWHGAEILAKSYAELIKEKEEYRKKTRLMFVGDGVKMSEVKDIIKKEKIEKNIILTGLIPQEYAPKYLSAMDVFVSPHVPNSDGSKFFGSPTKLFEYMAMEKPIVASDLEQIGKILKNEYSAIMVKPGDINDLRRGMEKVLNMSDKEKKTLGKNARKEVIEKYTWKKHVESIIGRIKKQDVKKNTS